MNTGGILAALQPKVRHRKRTSKRRWKARCRAGRRIPTVAIIEHELQKWYAFELLEPFNAEFCRVKRRMTWDKIGKREMRRLGYKRPVIRPTLVNYDVKTKTYWT